MANCVLCTEFDNCPWRTDPDAICSGFKQKPMTNGDRIRNMTDEELAEVIKHPCDIWNHIPTEWCASRSCGYQCSLDWLKQEANDEH